MFCRKCGASQNEDSRFCSGCGVAHDTQETTGQAASHRLNTSPNSLTSGNCTITFSPKRILGQLMVSKAVMVVAGQEYTTKFKKPIDIQLAAGQHIITCYAKYLGQSCKKQIQITFEPNRKYKLSYRTSVIVFMQGSIKVENV